MGALAGLVGESLGVERVPMQFASAGGTHSPPVGDRGHVAVQDVVPFGVEDGQPARLIGVFHPAGPELTIARSAQDSGLSAFGISAGGAGKSGFSHPFAWAA